MRTEQFLKNLLTVISSPLCPYLPKFSTGVESLRCIDAICHYSHVFKVQNGNVHVNPLWVPITYLCFNVKSFSSLPLIHSHKVLSICAECKKFYSFVNRFEKKMPKMFYKFQTINHLSNRICIYLYIKELVILISYLDFAFT